MLFAVSSKVNIRKPVVIDVSDSNTTAIVVINIIQDAKTGPVFKVVGKFNIGFSRRYD